MQVFLIYGTSGKHFRSFVAVKCPIDPAEEDNETSDQSSVPESLTTERLLIAESFAAEREAYMQLGEHRNTMTLLDTLWFLATPECPKPTIAALIMPYCENGSLDGILNAWIDDFESLENEGALIEDEESCLNAHARKAIDVFHDTMQGLQHIHNCGLVHHDLKGENILSDAQGRYIITDLGMCVKVGTWQVRARGTDCYMPPEMDWGCVCNGGYTVAYAQDIWSIGVTILEFVSLVPIPRQDIVCATAYESCCDLENQGLDRADAEWLRKFQHGPELLEILQDCLQFNPDLRPTTEALLSRVEALWRKTQGSQQVRAIPEHSLCK